MPKKWKVTAQAPIGQVVPSRKQYSNSFKEIIGIAREWKQEGYTAIQVSLWAGTRYTGPLEFSDKEN